MENILHDGIFSIRNDNLNICGTFVLGCAPSYERQFSPLKEIEYTVIKKKISMQIDFPQCLVMWP